MDSLTHEVAVVQPGMSRTWSGAVGCAISRSSYWHVIYLIMSLSRCESQHRLPSLSFSPSDILSFPQQLVAPSFFQILTISSFHYRLANMLSFFSTFTGLATLLSLLGNVQARSNSTNGPSCGVAEADDSSYFSVVGVQGTGVYPRQELRELEKDTELWNIFIQAFARFQAMDQSQKTSFYQVAGMISLLLLKDVTNTI